MKIIRYFFSVAAFGLLAAPANAQQYLRGDFHQHTTYTDGNYSFGYMMKKNYQYGLDWWANSEHGGSSTRDAAVSGLDNDNFTRYWDEYRPIPVSGSEKFTNEHRVMWRWQVLKDYSFRETLKARRMYPGKTILQSYEMNIPGFEHGSMGIVNGQSDSIPHCNPLAEFEYLFDQNDADTTGGQAQGWIKSNSTGRDKAIEALRWLRNRYPYTSYLILAHPERKPQHQQGYTIAAIRDLNNEAPIVCFGFESIPGHQREAQRGGYDHNSVGGGTYGGAGIFSAKTGGVWDALLSEGRRFWLFSNSDYHGEKGDFYPGEYQKNYTFTHGKSPEQIVEGLRSGNNWVVNGDLIDSLIFTVETTDKTHRAVMGSTLFIKAGESARVTIKARDPNRNNHNTYSNYRNPELHHIDLIAGEVTGMIPPTDRSYTTDTVATTRVIARFDRAGGITDSNGLMSRKWKQTNDGWVEMTFEIHPIGRPVYFRLRGTNHGLNVPNETDENGNPLNDKLVGANNAEKAFADLWFYSNPVFVTPRY